ncbi:hypothetical protein Mgra_00005771 [Meloidogyne graminicola]|uniref:Uncharacterized protein n=1 Tax=Meloidogyne graminicola TaxID=189291 RepID=A0A8S9ZN76_9BILA|nr:hypothetical protein Mgra_00005771 [Meloidogyne graminicola]
MSRISSMARLRVAAALEDERKKELEQQQNGASTSKNKSCNNNNNSYGHGSPCGGPRGRLPSVAKFLSARRRSKSHSRLLDSSFFLRIVAAFDENSSCGRRCHHSHLDEGLCGRFMTRRLLGQNANNSLRRQDDHSCNLNGISNNMLEDGNDAELYSLQMDMPIKEFNFNLIFIVLNGSPGYINILDGLNAWQLVSELSEATGQPAAASFKHVSPAGAAIGVPLNDSEAQSLMVTDLAIDTRRPSLASALARAREQFWHIRTPNFRILKKFIGADRMSSFGDFIALSQKCDEITAKLISREISDGVIAPDYDDQALSMLAKKKNGNYVILKIDPKNLPAEDEVRTIFGLKLKQKRNAASLSTESFTDVAVGDGGEITSETVDDLLVACVAVKYTQSDAVCFAHRGQVIGMGAGQQNRLTCTRLAGEKAANWWLRQHPRILSLPWRANVRRAEKANIIDAIVAGIRIDDSSMSLLEPKNTLTNNIITEANERQWNNYFATSVRALSQKERKEWLDQLKGVCIASESHFPGRECIDLAKQFGAKFVVTSSGGANDDDVCEACERNNMILVYIR